MWLEMSDLYVRISRKRLKGADLIGNHVFEIVRPHVDTAAAKTPEIVEARVRANGYALQLCLADNPAHGQRIACMKAAGDIGRADDFQDA